MSDDDTPQRNATHELQRETLRQLRELRDDVHGIRNKCDFLATSFADIKPTVAAVSNHPDRIVRLEERMSTVSRIMWGTMGVAGSAIVIEILNLILKIPVQH